LHFKIISSFVLVVNTIYIYIYDEARNNKEERLEGDQGQALVFVTL